MLDWASLQLYARHADGDDTRPVVFRPFRGLLPFQQEHRRFHFGHDQEIAEVLAKLQSLVTHREPGFLVVAGASGTGKSSLVFAGAVPKLLAAEPDQTVLRMRPGSSPDTALDAVLSGRPAQGPALLVVDQFEEVFTQTASAAARQAFVRRLWSLASSHESGVCVVITLRVDFLGRCGDLLVDDAGLRLDRIAYNEPHRVFVAQLGPEQLRAAAEKPARTVGLELQAGLADRLVNDVGAEPGALPLLEDALDMLWQRRSDRTLTQAAYEDLGGIVGTLQGRADAILHRLSREDQTLAQRLLVSLVTVADDTALDSRLRVPVAELRQSVAMDAADGFDRVLKELVDARLLVLGDAGQSPTVEVAHEALIRKWPTLRAWLAEDRAGLLIQRRVKQAAQLWDSQGRDDSLLFHGAQLTQATQWRKTWESRIGELERSFLDASEALRTKRDPAAARSARLSGSLLLILGQLLLYAIAFAFMGHSGATPATVVTIGVSFLASAVLATFFFRRTLMANSFHRGLVLLGITSVAQVVAVRFVSWRLGLPTPAMLAVDAMVAAGGVVVIAQQYLPFMWGLAVFLGATSVANLFLPNHAFELSMTTHLVVLLALPYAWARAARSGA